MISSEIKLKFPFIIREIQTVIICLFGFFYKTEKNLYQINTIQDKIHNWDRSTWESFDFVVSEIDPCALVMMDAVWSAFF